MGKERGEGERKGWGSEGLEKKGRKRRVVSRKARKERVGKERVEKERVWKGRVGMALSSSVYILRKHPLYEILPCNFFNN